MFILRNEPTINLCKNKLQTYKSCCLYLIYRRRLYLQIIRQKNKNSDRENHLKL